MSRSVGSVVSPLQEDALGPETIFAMGEIAERYRQSMIDLRARFPKAYRQVSRRRWKALRKAMEAKRPPSVVGPPPSPPSDETPAGRSVPDGVGRTAATGWVEMGELTVHGEGRSAAVQACGRPPRETSAEASKPPTR